MLDFSYQSIQTFQYQNKANIDRINMIEGLTNVKFIEQEKIVQYTLDRKKYIRLSDLMFWIETNFARFHLGQLLQLFKKLIEKVKYLNEQNIEHQYLTLDRIWLQLDNQSSTVSIIYKNISYKIVFLGYEFQFIEENLPNGESSKKRILEFICMIINRCSSQIKLQNDDKKGKDMIEKEIYQPIKENCLNMKFDETLQIIDHLLTRFSYNEKFQSISLDEERNNSKNQRREGRIQQVQQDLGQILVRYQSQEQLFIEQAFCKAIPDLVKEMDSIVYYAQLKFNYEELHEKCEEIKKSVTEYKLNYKEKIGDHLKQNLVSQKLQFKFEISTEDEDQMLNSINDQLGQLTIYSYIYNSAWILYYYKRNIQEMIDQISSKCYTPLADEILQNHLSLLILQLIQELI